MLKRWLPRISNWRCVHTRLPIGKRLLLLSLILFLTSCLEVKQRIEIKRDGSGETTLEIAVQREWAPMVIPKLKADAPRGWIISDEKEKEGKHVIVFIRKFRDISEVNDDEAKYAFSSQRTGFMRSSYAVEVTQLKSSDLPFPFEVSIKLPGSIGETSGTKVSSGEVRWDLQGIRKGTTLSVKSSAFGLPDYAHARESLSQFINSMLYQEAILFSSGDKLIYLMDADGGTYKKIIADGWGASWSSEVRKIVFFSDRNGNEEIYSADIDGNNVKRLTNNPAADWAPAWSPDGTRIVFLSNRDGHDEVYVMRADASDVRRLTNSPCRKFSPSWSPDGSTIAFHSCDDTYYRGYYHNAVYLIDADRIGVRMLPNSQANSERPSWSPNGQNIAFSSDRGGRYSIYVMERNGSSVRKVTNTSNDHRPLWSPDGNRIAYVAYDGQSEIRVIDADGRNSRSLAKFPAGDGELDAWVVLSRVSFVSPGVARMGIVIIMAVTGGLAVCGVVLMARRMIRGVAAKSTGRGKSGRIYCAECGSQNVSSASYCTNCGHKLR